MKILVLGGTGYVGSRLVPRLIGAGYTVRCLVRDPSRSLADGAEVVAGDVLDRASVAEAVKQCDRIVYLVHSMRSRKGSFEELDLKAAANVAAVAKDAGVQQIVYLGGLGRRSDDQTPHLRSRHEVARALRSGGVPVLEFRAAVIIGAGSASFEMIRALVTRLPVMICPKWVHVKTQPIAIADILAYLLAALGRVEIFDGTVDIGGPDVLSYKSMMMTVAEQMGLRRWIVPVPVLTPWLSSHWVNLVTPISAPLARALIESVRSETVCEDDRAREMFAIEPLSFQAAVQAALKEYEVQMGAKW